MSKIVGAIRLNAEDPIKKDAPKGVSPTVEFTRADRRGGRRSLIAVPMLARWTDDREHEMKINSRDISDGGIFFHANADIAIGAEVEVTFTLPSDPEAAGNKRLRVQGSVIRAEREADKTGYALAVTSSELLEADDTVAQARQAVRRLAASDSSGGLPRAGRARLFFLACSGMVGLTLLAGLGVFVIRRGGSAKAVASIREMAASVHSIPEHAAPPDVPQNRVERKRRVLRTREVKGTTEKNAASTPTEQEAAEGSSNASTAKVQSRSFDSTVQPGPVPFNNNNVLTLDVQKGKPVSALGYIGELPGPSAQSVPSSSLASTSTRTGIAAETPSSTAVVLQAVVGRDGRVEYVQRASGPAELAPAAIAAIRQWKFQPDPDGARHRQIYVTVNLTISTQ